MVVPKILKENSRSPNAKAWLSALPGVLKNLQGRWSLTIGEPYKQATCAWVAPAIRADGSEAVLKVGLPHMEADQEAHGLRFWKGEHTVQVFESDDELRAMLIERCDPGTTLRELSELEQDEVISNLLKGLWRAAPEPRGFRPLADMLEYWTACSFRDHSKWTAPDLVREGLNLFRKLSTPSPADVLLATDLHARNVLSAQRSPWLAIDPKPFVGDAAYDLTQHLFNCKRRLSDDPLGTIGRFAALCGQDPERVRLWAFARAAAEPRDSWSEGSFDLARKLRPSSLP